jgi:pyruvate carboxylase
VNTNIAFVENLLKHPVFLNNTYTTKFIDDTPALFHFPKRQDRGTKVLTYIADITVNGHPETKDRPLPVAGLKLPKPLAKKAEPQMGTRNLLEHKGPKAVADWMRAQQQLLITDTTMRDGHQSLLATRMRSIDMIRVAPAYAANLPQLLSVECWGGATFDVAYRFLQECPWQRLRDLREALPNLMTQMLLRGSNGVGYTNYPDNVVQAFVKEAAQNIDVFRVFDSLNWVENMRVAMDAVIEQNKICEGTICYTGDLLDPDRSKYGLKYYIGMAKELEAAGAHVLGLKDMAGLMKPASAKALVRALKQEVGLPMRSIARWTASRATPARRRWGLWSRRCATPTATPGWISTRSARSAIISKRYAANTPPSNPACRRRPPRSICTRCRAASSPTSRPRPAASGWRTAGTRSPRPMPM